MSKKGVGNLVFIQGNMTGATYKSILIKNLYESAKQLGISKQLLLMHDNDSKHRSQIVLDWIHSNKIETLPWPPHSPDLNPIEHVWALMKCELQKTPAKNLKELKDKIVEISDSIDEKTTTPLVNSVQDRLNECIKKKGYPTKY